MRQQPLSRILSLYQSQHLLQSANASPEILQRVARKALVSLDSVQNLAKGINLHGSTVQEHDIC